MSDYSDVLFDPRNHTHESCIKEISNCDMVIFIVGQRFGGTAIPVVTESVDVAGLERLSSKNQILSSLKNLSITQLEILKAVEQSIPIYTFVDQHVLNDHLVYEKNKSKPAVMKEIVFPSIQKNETAMYIFEFINFLTHRSFNNSLTSFTKLEDIKSHLIEQWSQLFQRLLSENMATFGSTAKTYTNTISTIGKKPSEIIDIESEFRIIKKTGFGSIETASARGINKK